MHSRPALQNLLKEQEVIRLEAPDTKSLINLP